MVTKIAGIFFTIILTTLFSLATGVIAAAPPPPPEADIAVIDSVSPVDNQDIPFGNVTVGNTSDQTVTVTNDGNMNLSIGRIANANPLASPFSILNEDCSNSSLAPAVNCTITVRFDPTSATVDNDSFDIPANDTNENPVTVSVSGTGTEIPSPNLVYPPDGKLGLGTTIGFTWIKGQDYGDNVKYDLVICEDNSFTTGCITIENIASIINNKNIFYAGTGIGFLLFGIVLVGGAGDKKKKTKKFSFLLSILLIIGMMGYSGCGSGGGGGTKKVNVSGTVLDAKGDPIANAQVTISSDPVTVNTESNGIFSVDVEAGEHSIVIKMDSELIYSGTFTCSEGSPLNMGSIDTIVGQIVEDGIKEKVSDLKSTTTYYWKVVADDGNGGTVESEVRSFTTQ